MNVAAIWEFIAGESRRTPFAVALAVVVAVVLLRTGALPGAAVGAVFALVIMTGLAAGVFEKT